MKPVRVLAVAALAFPAVLAAQQPSPPTPVANPIVASFKLAHTRYGGWLAQAFDSIPASKYNYKPTPVQMSVGNVAEHLESANYQLCALMNGDTRTMTAKDSLADSVKALWPKDTLTARLKA